MFGVALDETQQTTLELEIITAYAQIDTLNVPSQFKTKHLIIDEVQDNSLFEFIYTLKYVNKFQTSLFMVGDGSQTLYEFRASNPKALNILEMTEYFSQTTSILIINDFSSILRGEHNVIFTHPLCV